MKNQLCYTLASLMALSLPVAAKSTPPCKTIDAAISANEEFVEAILEANPQARVSTRKDMSSLTLDLGSALSAEAKTASASAIARLDAALAAGNERDAMVAAMQNYAVLVEAFKAKLPTSQTVAMLDHAGFSLQALSSTGETDWVRVKAVQTALAADAKAIDTQIEKGPLADLLHDTLSSIDAAIAQSDGKWLNASALILLDSVDLVETAVKNRTPGACH
jgi:hypothetical protein